MRTGRPLKDLVLADDEREKLEQWAASSQEAQRLGAAIADCFGLRVGPE